MLRRILCWTGLSLSKPEKRASEERSSDKGELREINRVESGKEEREASK